MKDVFIKLRINFFICCFFFKKITEPFQIVIACTKRYFALRKIDAESKDRWERHLKIRELEKEDELMLRKQQFHLLRTQIIGAFFRTSICTEICARLQKQPDKVDSFREEFQKNKVELLCLLEKLKDYPEISFSEQMKADITNWDFNTFKTQEDLLGWSKNFSEYICTLDFA